MADVTMALTPEWVINQQPLETLARRISADEGLQQTPEQRDVDVEIAGMDGELDRGMDPTTPRRTYGPGRIVFTGWLQGVDPDTGRLGPGVSWDRYIAQVDELVELFAPRRLVIDHLRPDGTRRAIGKQVGIIEPRRERTEPILGRWQVTIKIPACFWSGLVDITVEKTVASGGAIPLGPLGVGNAPITDALLAFGPGSNPTLVQAGTFTAWDGVIPAGRELVVDPVAREVASGAGGAWSGAAPADSAIRYGPGARWVDLDPTAGDPVLNHTGGGTMRCSITGRPKWKTS